MLILLGGLRVLVSHRPEQFIHVTHSVFFGKTGNLNGARVYLVIPGAGEVGIAISSVFGNGFGPERSRDLLAGRPEVVTFVPILEYRGEFGGLEDYPGGLASSSSCVHFFGFVVLQA